jgi:transcriptional regulator with XRE-family HTH domain
MAQHPDPAPESFGAALQARLSSRSLSPPELARKMGVDRTLPAHWIANRKAPSVEDLVSMSRVLAIAQRDQPAFFRLAADERARLKAKRQAERDGRGAAGPPG